MRIAYISFEYPPDSAHGGIATYVQQAARLMVRRGHDVEVFASSPNRSESSDDEGVRVHWIAEQHRLPFAESLMSRFAGRHLYQPFDIVEGPEYFADAREVQRAFPQLPVVVKMHTPSRLLRQIGAPPVSAPARWGRAAVQTGRKIAGALRRGAGFPRHTPLRELALQNRIEQLEKAHARAADLVLGPSLDLVEYAATEWGVPRERVRHVPYPFIPNYRMLDIPAETRNSIVGFLGRLEWRKGIQDLAAAIPLVAQVEPHVRFRLIGRSTSLPGQTIPSDEYVRRVAGPFADRVEMPGPVPLTDIPAKLAEMDVTVFPSVWENFPNVCLEAMSAARGVIGSRAGGMRDMLEGGFGLLVHPQQPREIAEAILHLVRNPGERTVLGRKARKRVLDEYNGERIGSLMEEVYSEAIRGQRRAGTDSIGAGAGTGHTPGDARTPA